MSFRQLTVQSNDIKEEPQLTHQDRPRALTVQPQNIPADLQVLPRWVGWVYKLNDKGEWDKPPLNCRTGRPANCIDPSTWVSFDRAVDALKKQRFDGIGFVFTREDGFVGVDLDRCRHAEKSKEDAWAYEIVKRLNTYTELSPSGTGLKCIIRGTLPDGSVRKGQIEVYDQAKYFAITGQRIKTTPATLQQADIRGLCYALALPARDDDTVIRMAKQARNGVKFQRLWSGDFNGYQSQSEADLALCEMLAYWCGPNVDQIERLFSRSELAKRRKWERREENYRDPTIEQGLKKWVQAVWDLDVNQDIQDLQDYQEVQDSQVLQALPRKYTHASQGLAEVTSDVREEAVQIAMELAETSSELPDWQVMFLLARKILSRLAGERNVDVEAFQESVLAFCERVGRSAEEYWECFQTCWSKVKLAEGEDLFQWALNMANKEPYMAPKTPLDRLFAQAASVMYHLGEFRKPKSFWITGTTLASLLKIEERRAYRLLDLLQTKEVIKCVNANYSFKKHIAREFVFIGKLVTNPDNRVA
jgi:hypothetical protein